MALLLDKALPWPKLVTRHLEAGNITAKQASLLSSYFENGRDVNETAKNLGVMPRSVVQSLVGMSRRKIIRRQEKQYEMAVPADVKPEREQKNVFSDEWLTWMLVNYKHYRRNRSAAARILGCSRTDICRMAIILKIDS